MTTAQWRTLTYVLAVIFLVLVALLVVVVLGRTDDDGLGSAASPTPRATAATPSGTIAGQGSEPTPEPSASAFVGGSPSAVPSPSAPGAVPGARAVIRDLGLDDPDGPQARPRVIVFTSDGGGDVTVKLQKTSGKVKVCIYPGTLAKPLGDPACLRNAGGTLTGHAKGKKPFTWTVTLVATKAGTNPTADLRIDWPATAPRLEIADFRLQGEGSKPHNGIVVDLAGRPAAGPLAVVARWTGEHPFVATIADRDTGATLRSADGDAAGVDLEADLKASQRPSVSLSNPGSMVATEVLATLTLTWP